MLPISPPLPLIHKTVVLLPSSGSISSILELVFPPPKFVIRKSDPNKLDRYRSNSGPPRRFAIWSSQRSSRYRGFSFVFMGRTLAGFHGRKLLYYFMVWTTSSVLDHTLRKAKLQ